MNNIELNIAAAKLCGWWCRENYYGHGIHVWFTSHNIITASDFCANRNLLPELLSVIANQRKEDLFCAELKVYDESGSELAITWLTLNLPLRDIVEAAVKVLTLP